jgi:hypothetical protein
VTGNPAPRKGVGFFFIFADCVDDGRETRALVSLKDSIIYGPPRQPAPSGGRRSRCLRAWGWGSQHLMPSWMERAIQKGVRFPVTRFGTYVVAIEEDR